MTEKWSYVAALKYPCLALNIGLLSRRNLSTDKETLLVISFYFGYFFSSKVKVNCVPYSGKKQQTCPI
jgi:hypothetical protein